MMTGGSGIDAAAFDRFAVVLFGSPPVIAAVETIRQSLPPSGRPILPGHVTVKGTFIKPHDLVRTVETLRAACAEFPPIALTADQCRTCVDGPYVGAWLTVEPSDVLSALHWRLVEQLADHGETIYPGESTGDFRPHLTIVQEVPAEHEASILATINAAEHRFTWTASEVALVGRRGGLAWETLATFPLGAQAQR